MKKEELEALYGRIYDFTEVAGDDALEVLDSHIENEGLTEVFDRFLDEADLSEADAARLGMCFEEILSECEDEFGDYEEDED